MGAGRREGRGGEFRQVRGKGDRGEGARGKETLGGLMISRKEHKMGLR